MIPLGPGGRGGRQQPPRSVIHTWLRLSALARMCLKKKPYKLNMQACIMPARGHTCMNYAGTRGMPSANFMTVTELPDNFDQKKKAAEVKTSCFGNTRTYPQPPQQMSEREWGEPPSGQWTKDDGRALVSRAAPESLLHLTFFEGPTRWGYGGRDMHSSDVTCCSVHKPMHSSDVTCCSVYEPNKRAGPLMNLKQTRWSIFEAQSNSLTCLRTKPNALVHL
jgi:hypothetical protein